MYEEVYQEGHGGEETCLSLLGRLSLTGNDIPAKESNAVYQHEYSIQESPRHESDPLRVANLQ